MTLAEELSAARTRASRRRDSGTTSTSHSGPAVDAEELAAAESFSLVFRPEDFLRKADVEDDVAAVATDAEGGDDDVLVSNDDGAA